MVYIDVDRAACPRVVDLYAIFRVIHVRPVWICFRRTRRGWHAIVRLRDRLQSAEIIALQACCGSDPRRETLNLMRVLSIRRAPIRNRFWRRRWNLLYQGKLT